MAYRQYKRKKQPDDDGIFWDKDHRARVDLLEVLPDIDWKPPNHFPNLTNAKRICVDVETKDLQLKELGCGARRGGYIVGVSIAIEDGGSFYYPLRHEGGGNTELNFWEWAKDVLNNYNGEVVGANILYDLDYLANEGITFGPNATFMDIQVAEFLIDENQFRYSLDFLCNKYLGTTKDITDLKRAASILGISDPIAGAWKMPGIFVGVYGEYDAVAPLLILREQEKAMKRDGLMEVWELECGLTPMMLYMRRNGVRIGVEKAGEVEQTLIHNRDEHIQAACLMAGRNIRPWAKDDFIDVLQKRGLKFGKTPKGDNSITKSWLEKNAKDPFVNHILNARNMDKIISTFIDGYIRKHVIDGRIHCEFHQSKARSGRFSSSNPNLQNIPKRDEEIGPLMRGLFIPEPDEKWVSFDWSQIEFRFLAHYGVGEGSDLVRDMYNSDPETDFHDMCMKMCEKFGMKRLKRSYIKNVNFGTVYGMGASRTASTMGVDTTTAQQFLKQYHKALPFVRETTDKAAQIAQNRGFIKTITGRRRRFELWEPRDYKENIGGATRDKAIEKWGKGIKRSQTYKALNAVIQGSAADLMKIAMLKIWESGVCDVIKPLITVHDELNFSAGHGKECGDALFHVQHNIMENCMKLKVPILAERSDGDDWGSL